MLKDLSIYLEVMEMLYGNPSSNSLSIHGRICKRIFKYPYLKLNKNVYEYLVKKHIHFIQYFVRKTLIAYLSKNFLVFKKNENFNMLKLYYLLPK